jgi:hypothetical protein
MTQAILVQEAAIKSLDDQNKQLAEQVRQLQAELQSAKTQPAAPATSGGGFLSSIFGGGSRDPQPAPTQSPPASSGGGWREPARPSFNSFQPPQQNFGAAPPQQNYAPQQQAGSGFLGGALKTAAGVAGGVMLAQGISSLFQHNQQPEVVEVVKEEPAQVNDQGDSGNGWGDDQRVADTNANDQGGFTDADYSDDSSSFFGGDDDSFV